MPPAFHPISAALVVPKISKCRKWDSQDRLSEREPSLGWGLRYWGSGSSCSTNTVGGSALGEGPGQLGFLQLSPRSPECLWRLQWPATPHPDNTVWWESMTLPWKSHVL